MLKYQMITEHVKLMTYSIDADTIVAPFKSMCTRTSTRSNFSAALGRSSVGIQRTVTDVSSWNIRRVTTHDLRADDSRWDCGSQN